MDRRASGVASGAIFDRTWVATMYGSVTAMNMPTKPNRLTMR